MSEQQITRRLAAILAADVAGYSSMMERDEAGTLAGLWKIWRETFNPAVAARHGRLVKLMGDGALVEFASVVDAVECAITIQRAMGERNRMAELPMAFRIGVTLGEVVVEGDDIFGDGVNVAARLEGQAPQGGILISDAVRTQVDACPRPLCAGPGEPAAGSRCLPSRPRAPSARRQGRVVGLRFRARRNLRLGRGHCARWPCPRGIRELPLECGWPDGARQR